MATLAFKKATKKAARLRLALGGLSGSGKTWTSLALASALGQRVAVIDTERGSASLYADQFSFDVLELQDHSPQAYVEAIKAAEREGYDVIVIDSLSHAWMGKGGALEQVDAAAKRSSSKNSFMAWRDVTPVHNALVDAMLQSPAHIITTIRAKSDWVVDEVNGKKTPRKIGTAWVQRDGLEFEFTVVGDLDLDHNLVVSKTRWSKISGAVINRPGADLAREMLAWLNDGDPAPPANAKPTGAPPSATPKAGDPNAEAAQVREELGALAAMFGGMDKMLAEIGKPKPTNLQAAKAVLAEAQSLHAQRTREAAESETAFSMDAPKGEAPALRAIDGGGERPTADRTEKAREVIAHGEAAKSAPKASRGSKPKAEATPPADYPSDDEWDEFYFELAQLDQVSTREDHRSDFLRAMHLDSPHQANRGHLREYLAGMRSQAGIKVADAYPEDDHERDEGGSADPMDADDH